MQKYIVEKKDGSKVQICLKCYKEFPTNENLNHGFCNQCYNILQNEELLRQSKLSREESKKWMFWTMVVAVIVGSNQIILFLEQTLEIANQLIIEITDFLRTINPVLIIGFIVLLFIYLDKRSN